MLKAVEIACMHASFERFCFQLSSVFWASNKQHCNCLPCQKEILNKLCSTDFKTSGAETIPKFHRG